MGIRENEPSDKDNRRVTEEKLPIPWLERRSTRWFIQAAAFAAAAWLSFLLRFDFTVPADRTSQLMTALAVWMVVKLAVFHREGMDRGWAQFVSASEVSRVVGMNVKASVLSAVAILLIIPSGFPRSIYLIDLALSVLGTVGIRLGARTFHEYGARRASGGRPKRIFIYGAGAAGELLLQDARSNARVSYQVAGFIDDNPAKKGMVIHGLRVLGPGRNLAQYARKHRVQDVLIAVPSATGQQMCEILGRCHEAGVSCKTVPGLHQLLRGAGLAGQVREVAVEDLLGRQPVRLEEETIGSLLNGSVVMVTGAGGSIGSELCRQIARFQPKAIVGYEISENAMYELANEMKVLFPGVVFHPAMGSIQNVQRLADVMSEYRPRIVYHAAAYKHVPMMEDHPFEAIENNVFGTLNVAEAAREYGAERFVLISSDKAVRPTNVMGATKRVAELITKAMQNGGTKFVAVRFGNVLGSNGSVIPLFKKQIAARRPVTVTHPDMQRYFMTISEAVQLVLQASAMGEGGEVFVLDMGQPVRILDLARNLIALSGLKPDEDIRIEFTGVRPGEKLCEELSMLTESTVPTRHEKIRIFTGPGLSDDEMRRHLDALGEAAESRDAYGVVRRLQMLAPDYRPSRHVLAISRQEQHHEAPVRRKAMAVGY
ncbi:MAG: polysaccharide biosynthesis protein [Bryobacteraceae bacterium]|nr:polysaccharide biosynthesis protein [Bryobacteraceae bacterium]